MNGNAAISKTNEKQSRNEKEIHFRLRISKLLAKARTQKGITQKELAIKIGVTTNALALYETNHAMPSLFTLSNMVKILELDLYELFDIPEYQTVMVFKDGQVETYKARKPNFSQLDK